MALDASSTEEARIALSAAGPIPNAVLYNNARDLAAAMVAAGVTLGDLTGDVTSVGLATSIASGVIVDDDINHAANISPYKIAGWAVVDSDSRLMKTFRFYGAVGDNVTNDGAALQTALDTTDALILDGEGLTYKITSTLSLLRSNVRIQNAIFDCSGSVNSPFTVGGASLLGTAVSLTVNTLIGSNTVTVADTSTFTANQLVLLKSTAAVSNQSGLASTYGQLARVVSLTATTLTLTNSSMLTFATADSATVTPISALTNVTFDRVHFVGNSGGATGAFGLTATYCDNLLIENCSSISIANFGFFLVKCYNSAINNCNVNKSTAGSSTVGGTAFALSGSYNCSVTNSKADTVLHGAVIYSGDTLTIGTRIANNVITNTTKEGIYLGNASVESVVIGNKVSMAANNNVNVSIVCYGGSSVISNNSVNDVRIGGIYYQPLLDNTPSATVTATQIKTNVKIHNNTINYLDNATGAGIFVALAQGAIAAPSISGVIITNNTITGGATAATNITYGIYIQNQSTTYSGTISDVIIANNVVDSTVEVDACLVYSIGATGVTNLINNVKIVDNVFRGGRSGILVLSGGTPVGVLTNFNIDNNTLYGGTYGLRASEAATTGIRYNNNKIETGSAGYFTNAGGGRVTPTSIDVQTSETGHLIVADTAALTALGAMPEGTMAYQLDTNLLYVYDGSLWRPIGGNTVTTVTTAATYTMVSATMLTNVLYLYPAAAVASTWTTPTAAAMYTAMGSRLFSFEFTIANTSSNTISFTAGTGVTNTPVGTATSVNLATLTTGNYVWNQTSSTAATLYRVR